MLYQALVEIMPKVNHKVNGVIIYDGQEAFRGQSSPYYWCG